MANSILTLRQKDLLEIIFEEIEISSHFYLTGGSALAEYYLHHRYSEDLDFFSMNEVNTMSIQVFFKKISKRIGLNKVDYQQSFNRNLYFLHFDDEIIKTEFTYYPFQSIDKKLNINNIIIDSLIDIAVNKTFTIYQNPRMRDFIDLYLIMVDQKWNFSDLLKNARIKFDTHIDPLQLGQQLMKVTVLKDFPRMLNTNKDELIKEYWLNETRKLKTEALK